MRQQKGYENFLLPRIPFLIDSVVNPTVAQLRKGDQIVAIDNVFRVSTLRATAKSRPEGARRRFGAADSPAGRGHAL